MEDARYQHHLRPARHLPTSARPQANLPAAHHPPRCSGTQHPTRAAKRQEEALTQEYIEPTFATICDETVRVWCDCGHDFIFTGFADYAHCTKCHKQYNITVDITVTVKESLDVDRE